MMLTLRRGPLALALGFAALLATPAHAQTVRLDDYLKAPDIDSDDIFGTALVIDGDTLVVSSTGDDSAGAGVGSDLFDDTLGDAGGVFVYVRAGEGWALQEYLKPTDPTNTIRWGESLALDGNTLVVGAPRHDIPANDAGAVYVFIRVGTTWLQQGVLRASTPGVADFFGVDVALSGDTLVVGASFEDGGDAGVNGDESLNTVSNAGAAYVFTRTAGVWTQEAYLKASNPGPTDNFGGGVAIDGDTIVVTAPGEDGLSTGIDGDQFNDGTPGVNVGAAYVFTRDAGSWSQQAYVKPSTLLIRNEFGVDVALEGDRFLVGAPVHGECPGGIGTVFGCGGAGYVFERSGSTWSEVAELVPATVLDGEQYGVRVALEGSRLLLGATRGNSPLAVNAGSFVLYEHDGAGWAERVIATAPNADNGDQFYRLGLSGDTVVVGASGEDSGDDSGGNTGPGDDFGAVYTYTITSWSDEGCELAGTAGAPELIGDGTLEGGTFNEVALRDAAPSAFCGLFIATTDTPTPFKAGTLKPVPWLKLTFLNTNASGRIDLPFVMPVGLPSGIELWTQIAVTDAGAPAGVALSNALLGVAP